MRVVCPQCGLAVSVAIEAPVMVACPRAACRHLFVATPAGTIVKAEARETPFLCASTGTEFFVVFGRVTRKERFTVRKIHTERGWLERTRAAERARLSAPPATTNTQLPVPIGGRALAVAALPEKRGGFLAALGGAIAGAGAPAGEPEATWRPLAPDELVRHTTGESTTDVGFDLTEFELADWRCAHCPAPHANFVLCGRCRRYVCLGRGSLKGADWYFQCTTACGESGMVSPTLTHLSARGFDVAGMAGRRDAGLITHAGPLRLGR